MPMPIIALLQSARDARTQGRRADARRGYGAAAEQSRHEGDLKSLAHALRHMADMDREDAVPGAGLRDAMEAVSLYRDDPDATPLDLANALRPAALALEVLDRKDAARPLWLEACELYAAAGVEAGVAECRSNLVP